MSHSNSSLNTFTNCMAKYEHNYILHTPLSKPISPHLTFGTMAHEVLYKAGKLRDNAADKLMHKGDYDTIIPSEVLYGDLKQVFNINNWYKYFYPIIKQVSKYEEKLLNELLTTKTGDVSIERELKLQLTVEQLKDIGCDNITQPFVGVIDLLMITKTHAIILDYKFSNTRKTQDDFDINSQLQMYALFIHILYDIPLHNIKYGYIDIPKQMFDTPVILSNGTLSRAKSQNVSQEDYKNYVNAIHGKWYNENNVEEEFDPSKQQKCIPDPYYNCELGGYYYECYCNMALNKAAYLSVQYLDIDTYNGVIGSIFDTAKMIDFMRENKMPFLKKYDSYSCKGCEYIDKCKPWTEVNNG